MGDDDRPRARARGVGGQQIGSRRLVERRSRAPTRSRRFVARGARGARAGGDHQGVGARPAASAGRAARAPTTSSCSTRPPRATASGCCARRARSPRSRASGRSPRRPSRSSSLLENPSRSAIVAVALPAELPVTETLELEGRMATRARARRSTRSSSTACCRAASPRPTSSASPRPTARSRPPSRRATRPPAGQAQHAAGPAAAPAPRRGARRCVTLPFLATPNLEVEDVRMLGDELAGAADAERRLDRVAPTRSRGGRAASRRRASRGARGRRGRGARGCQLALELLARGGADGLDHLAAGADQDPLLRLGLDPDQRADDASGPGAPRGPR